MKKTASPKKLSLKVDLRKIVGKKVRNLRRQGLVPGNVFGSDFKSISVSVGLKDFIVAYKIARETGVIYLTVEGKELPVLIKNIQLHPVSDKILHVDFRKIDLTKKIETAVPVKITGLSEAVSQKGGVLLMQMESLTVEALPEDIPTQIDVDVSVIKEVGQEIKVGDLVKSAKFTVKDQAEKVIVSVVAHKEESITPETAAAAPEIITEAEKGEAVEGEAAPETAAPEKTKEPSPAKSEAPSKK